MKKLFLIKVKLLVIFLALFISNFSYADVINGEKISIYNENPKQHFIVSETSGYKHYFSSLKDIVWIEKQKDKTNHFCMIGYKWLDNKEEAIIFWQEMNYLYRWKPKALQSDDIVQLFSLRTAQFYSIDSLDNIPLSPTYLGSPTLMLDDAKRLIDDCDHYGEKITVKPIKISQECLKDSICYDIFEATLAEHNFLY